MKQMITIVIAISIVFVLIYRFSRQIRAGHNVNQQPQIEEPVQVPAWTFAVLQTG